MAISRLSTSRLTQGLPKYQSAWDQDNVQQGALVPLVATTPLEAASNISITNIPQTYQDLMVVISHNTQQSGSSDDYMYMGLSGTTGTNYSVTRMHANGTSLTSDRGTNQDGIYGATRPAWEPGLFGSAIYHILNYANTTQYKTFLVRNAAEKQAAAGLTQLSVGTMRTTSAITALFIGGTSNYPGIGTTVTIYGVKAGA